VASPSQSATALPAAKPSSNRATGTRFDAAPAEDAEDQPKARGMRGSKLLGDVSDDPIGPLDRRSRFADRRSNPKHDKHASQADTGDHEPVQTLRGASNYAAKSGGSAAPNAMAPLLMASAVIALLAKGFFMSTWITKPGILANPATIDQIGEMIVLLGITLYAIKASQKS